MQAALHFKPVTKSTKDDFVALFEGKGGPSYCWCMAFRSTKEELKNNTKEARRERILGRIDSRVPVGLVGYLDGEPVAWVSIAPKETYVRLGGPEPEDGEKIWSLACMYLQRTHRRKGLGHELVDAAIAQAKKRGATVLEAYPVDPKSPSYRFMGFVPNFKARGFTEVAREGTRRHVMQLTLARVSRAKG
jgi:GNAT superfamily N-acetyltransferase